MYTLVASKTSNILYISDTVFDNNFQSFLVQTLQTSSNDRRARQRSKVFRATTPR